MTVNKIEAQTGPQRQFLSTPADIAIYGGAAGGGKTWALLMEPLRHVTNTAGFSAVIFRRNTTQVRNPGGLWDESLKIYGLTQGRPAGSVLEWTWPRGGKVKFSHLEYDKTVLDWQGAQIALICFDELTHFTRDQFFYLLSRNRSMCGVRPYVRATTNPDSDSWVAELIAWWIDPETGYPMPERAGKIRWFIRLNDTLIWADSKRDLLDQHGDENIPKSLTFIPASVHDNKALLDINPEYVSNLKALPAVERARLLEGNWKIRPAAGLYFQRAWVEVLDAVPADLETVRYWDLAATEKTDSNDPDWTCGVKIGRDKKTGIFYVLDVVRFRSSPHRTEEIWKNTAAQDGTGVKIGMPQDPGQAGKSQAAYIARQLSGFTVQTRSERGDKITRFGPFSAQCQAGNVKFLRAYWNDVVFSSLEGFPEAAHDDDADACSGAFAMFHSNNNSGFVEYFAQLAEAQKAKNG